jgi:hypothetical protein
LTAVDGNEDLDEIRTTGKPNQTPREDGFLSPTPDATNSFTIIHHITIAFLLEDGHLAHSGIDVDERPLRDGRICWADLADHFLNTYLVGKDGFEGSFSRGPYMHISTAREENQMDSRDIRFTKR